MPGSLKVNEAHEKFTVKRLNEKIKTQNKGIEKKQDEFETDYARLKEDFELKMEKSQEAFELQLKRKKKEYQEAFARLEVQGLERIEQALEKNKVLVEQIRQNTAAEIADVQKIHRRNYSNEVINQADQVARIEDTTENWLTRFETVYDDE